MRLLLLMSGICVIVGIETRARGPKLSVVRGV